MKEWKGRKRAGVLEKHLERKHGFTQEEWLHIYVALQIESRFNIVLYLINEGAKTIDEITEALHLPPYQKTQLWLDVYINPLLQKRLIDYADRPYYTKFEATEKAKKVMEILK